MGEKKDTIKAKTIITSHINSDFDAIASMLAAQKLYEDSVIIFPGSQEKSLRNFFIHSMGYLFNMADPDHVDFSVPEKLVIVDTRQPDRLSGVSPLLEREDISIDIYDHHPSLGGDIKGTFEMNRATGATITILMDLLRERNIHISPDEATVMALGIYEDTGLFTYSSTTREDFLQAAYLLDCGANLDTIVNLVVKEIKSEQVAWLNELLNEMVAHNINGIDIHISTISSPVYITDLASIVQKVVRMENLDVFFAVVLMGNKISIIARSRNMEVDVGRIMLAFGGGGHAYAASAKVDGKTLAQVELLLQQTIKQEIKPVSIADKLMSSPAITIGPDISCKNAGELLTRYNINSLLVVDQTNSDLLGTITRQVIEKVLFHNLADLPVRDYMNSEIETITSKADISQIERQIIRGTQRIIPVVDGHDIKGVITRTDFLNYLVQHNEMVQKSDNSSLARQMAKKRHIKNIMIQRLEPKVLKLLEKIGRSGYELGYNMFVVGGFVRDLLLGRRVDDIDIVVEGDGIAFAKHFAANNGCRVNTYKKFGTAVIIFEDGAKVDIASARLEYYASPASLPIVEKSSIKLDLSRRDFTINTLAIHLNPDHFGTLIDFFGATRDLKDKSIRIIHNLSFVEDPTRIFRAIKFANRFDFKIGKVTSNLIQNALKINCFKNLSGLRVLSEIKQILEEEDPIPAIKTLQEYNLDKVMHPQLILNAKTYDMLESVKKAIAWHDLLHIDSDYPKWAVYFMAVLQNCTHSVAKEICSKLKMPQKERVMVLDKRYKAEKCLYVIENTNKYTNSQLYRKLLNFKTESILYMMALAKSKKTIKAISYYYTHLRDKKNILKGKDLLDFGLKSGPVFSDILDALLDARLDRKVKSLDQEKEFVKSYIHENKLID
ncbi:MAG: CBS domain-containing protein [Desulfobacteraceae bacterium]|nr:MAG: CBS domain-containing protein [Desulfobacteraceae bacterium]